MVYKKGIGRMVTFKTGGTTYNKNNCVFAGDIKTQCDGTLPPSMPQ